ncbi:hypothetical protein ACSABO_002993 [Escherichia coli]|nr:hypothetical protein [Escherichia coli]MCV5859900.1 hypothetical protein [Escherichia coli]MDD0806848.1 hypothetical protein [Escherichia coli]MEC9676684.1 hypothetical protein [Escherichia coli]MEC9993977.1 hypothetical protein [Escherichia coli]MED0067376.1 hypothetical protein [Escherichia coli]
MIACADRRPDKVFTLIR